MDVDRERAHGDPDLERSGSSFIYHSDILGFVYLI
jgi:hypothetical protein